MAANGNGAAAVHALEQRLKATHGGVAEQVPPDRQRLLAPLAPLVILPEALMAVHCGCLTP